MPDPTPDAPAQGPNLSDEEILEALRSCAADLDKPLVEITWSEYLRWARRPDVRRRSGRRPRSQGPFDRLGGFRVAKRRALGLGEEEAEAAATGEARADGRGYGYSEAELFAAADEIIARLDEGAAWPTTTQWPRVRNEILAEERNAGQPPRAFPAVSVVWQRYGAWDKARAAYKKSRRRKRRRESQ